MVTEELAAELAGPRRALTLVESAAVLGGLRHAELALFAVLGRRAPLATSSEVAVWSASASLAAAWRAAELASLLPVSKGLPGVEASTRSSGASTDAALAALAAAEGDRALVAWTADPLYAALLQAYGSRADATAPAADLPVEVVLSRLVHDVSRQLEATEEILRTPW